jgi:hypothetical protein
MRRLHSSRLAAVVTLVVAALIAVAPAASAAPPAPADLSIYFVGPEEIARGQTAMFLFQAHTETSPRPENVRAVLTLPAGLTWESAEPGAVGCPSYPGEPNCSRNSGTCTPDATRTVVTCTADEADDIMRGTYSYNATVRASADVAVGTELTVKAEFTSDGVEATPENNTSTVTSTVILGSDLGITAVPPAAPVVPGEPVKFSLIVHNYGPGTISFFRVAESYGGDWYMGGSMTNEGTECVPDPGALVCEVTMDLASGEEVKLDHVMPTRVVDYFWGTKQGGGAHVHDNPDETSFDTTNNRTSFKFEFAKKPAGTPATTPAGDGTGGTGGTGGTAAGGLPITGAAALPLALGGALLLLLGTGAVLLTRRRKPRAEQSRNGRGDIDL